MWPKRPFESAKAGRRRLVTAGRLGWPRSRRAKPLEAAPGWLALRKNCEEQAERGGGLPRQAVAADCQPETKPVADAACR